MTSIPASYEELKNCVKTGDVIFIQTPGRFFGPGVLRVGFGYWLRDFNSVSRLLFVDVHAQRVRLTTLSGITGLKIAVTPDFNVCPSLRSAMNEIEQPTHVSDSEWVISILNRHQMFLQPNSPAENLFDTLGQGMGWQSIVLGE